MPLPLPSSRCVLTRCLLPLILLLPACTSPTPEAVNDHAYRTWEVYLGDNTSSQYSSLDQINTDNVGQLQVAWTYHTGDGGPGGRTQIQCNPIIIDSVLYATSPRVKVLALHAATGEETEMSLQQEPDEQRNVFGEPIEMCSASAPDSMSWNDCSISLALA